MPYQQGRVTSNASESSSGAMKCSVVQDVIHFSNDNLENMVHKPKLTSKEYKGICNKIVVPRTEF